MNSNETHLNLLLENLELTDVNPIICGIQKCDSAHAFGPAIREYFLVHYVIEGKGTLQNDRGQFAVEKGQMFIIRPFEITTYFADAALPWTYAWIGFTSTLKVDMLLQQDILDFPIGEHLFSFLYKRASDNTIIINKNLYASGKDNEHAHLPELSDINELFLCSKIYEMLSFFNQGFSKSIMLSNSENVYTNIYVNKAVNYIKSHYNDSLNISLLASLLGLDRSYFSRLFKQVTNTSPQEYIINYRLERAREILFENDLTNEKLAALVGYSDTVTFCRMYKKKFGFSPKNSPKGPSITKQM
ncbi:MAG: AraC family transcriptional regulator [Lachnospiraceae bacterium]